MFSLSISHSNTLRALLAALLLAGFSAAGADAASGVDLLKVENGARPTGMGGAFTAVAGDPLSQSYNPAATVGSSDFSAYFGHTAYWERINFETLALSFVKGEAQFNFSARLAEVSDLEARGPAPSDDPLYNFDARDIALKAGAAYPVTERLDLGLSAGWIIEKVDFLRGSSFNVDIGALYTQSPQLAFGASVTNLGGKLTLSETEIELPTTWRAGASYLLAAASTLLSADVVYLDESAHAHFGAEYTGIDRLELRAGFQSGYDSKNITFGAGFRQKDLRVDYAFVPYKN
ncbi:MAG TPA: PorV/PorQ family protein, partial [candidate division Zixibacteria bacterium]|nr:PorV/PorQ family protein [candidate division Zixibacteria bacterium]